MPSGRIPTEVIPTANAYGWTSSVLNQISTELIAYVAELSFQRTPRVLDIGPGFGVATLPALEAGAEVIALDPDAVHLAAIAEAATRCRLDKRLTVLNTSVPCSQQFSDLDAIHSSNVLHFLSGFEIERCACDMFAWLRPGGRTFIQVGTIYAGHVRALLPLFLQREAAGDMWPGEVETAKEYVVDEFRPLTPDFMNYLHDVPILKTFKSVGFNILKSWYYTRTGIPAACVNDGREHFGLIGEKP